MGSGVRLRAHLLAGQKHLGGPEQRTRVRWLHTTGGGGTTCR